MNANISFLRHNSLFGPEDVEDVYFNIIGVGATGSWAGLIAAKMGWHKFRVWDLDIVESHNCPNQIYNLSQVGEKKVDAFEATLKNFNPNITVEKHDYFFESDKHKDLLEGAVFIAVDTLSARKDIISCLKGNINVDIVYETRMGFSHATLTSFTPFDYSIIDNILSTMRSDDSVPESACNARIITTLTNIVASALVHDLCTFYSASRRDVEKKIYFNRLFSLSETLSTYQI